MENCEKEKIKLVLVNERALTFKADDYIKLRTEHRIIGKLVGAAVPYPRKIALNALPAYFTEYQTRFMLEHGIAELENKKQITEPPNEEMKEAYKDYKTKLINETERPYIESRLNVVKAKIDKIIEGKKAKLIKKGWSEEDINISPSKILEEEEERIKSSLTTTIAYSQVPTQHPFHMLSNRIREFPVSNMKKYKVFEDLWHKNLYITNAESFGGDFLTYYDDPMFFHASQIVHVVDEKEKFDLYFPVSCSRLAVSVKKKCVFAYVNDNGKVTYQTMHWDNPRLKELYANDNRKTEENSREMVTL